MPACSSTARPSCCAAVTGCPSASAVSPSACTSAAEGEDGAEHAVGHDADLRSGLGGADLLRQRGGAIPHAELAQDVRHAAQARTLELVGAARLAEADRGGERVAGHAVVAGDL